MYNIERKKKKVKHKKNSSQKNKQHLRIETKSI